jgi:chorismate dehydratase
MDSESLFKPTKESNNDRSQDDRFIGISDSLEYLPLIYGLKNKLINHEFDIVTETIRNSARKLREGEIELALISSLDYALKKETWHIIPDLCVSSAQAIKHIQLYFKKGLTDVQKVAVDKNAASELILLKILMREKYMMSPDYIEMDADLDLMLDKADSALIIGNKGLEYSLDHQNRLDLNEEWFDMTALPFVYSFWAGRELTITPDDIRIIKSSYELGINNLEKIAKKLAATHSHNWGFYHDFYTQNLSYTFSELEKDGLNEFYNYAFFYGYTEFIPDLFFYK